MENNYDELSESEALIFENDIYSTRLWEWKIWLVYIFFIERYLRCYKPGAKVT